MSRPLVIVCEDGHEYLQRFSRFLGEELELVRESVELFLNFRKATRQRAFDLGVRQQGYLWLTTSPDGAERQRRIVERQHGWGLADVELLDGDEVRGRFPFVGPDVVQGRFRAGDGFLDTVSLTLGLAEASRGDVVLETPVTGVEVTDGRLEAVVSRHRGALRQAASKLAVAPSEAAMGAGRSPPATAAPKGSAGRRKGTSPLVQQRRVRRQSLQRAGEAADVAGRHEQPLVAVVGEVGQVAGAPADHRQPEGHRLSEHRAVRLA